MIEEEGFVHLTTEDKSLLRQNEVVEEFMSATLTKDTLDKAFLETPEFTEELYLLMLNNYNFINNGGD